MSDLTEILRLLTLRTDAGSIKWKLANESLVTLKQANSFLEIREIAPETAYSFTVRNGDGLMLSSENYVGANPDLMMAKSIFQKTKRDALGVNKALEEIKKSLSGM
jgi:hypothetical protein